VNSNLRNQLKRGNFEIASNHYSFLDLFFYVLPMSVANPSECADGLPAVLSFGLSPVALA
jgi:hypothetical protein